MKGRKKSRGMKGGSGHKDMTLLNKAQESTGSSTAVGSAYGMPKAPDQPMAGAAKKSGKQRRMRY